LLYLSILIYGFNCRVNPLYVILLALFNDITMIPVAEDRQTASAAPQHTNVKNLIGFSVMLGVMQSLVSIVYYLCMDKGLVNGNLTEPGEKFPGTPHAQVAIWLQVSIAAELLIYVARAPGLFFLSCPSWQLFASTMLGNIISTILGLYIFPDPLSWAEVGIIWAWDICALFIVDLSKMLYKYTFEHGVSGIIDEAALKAEDARERPVAQVPQGDGMNTALTGTAAGNSETLSHLHPSAHRSALSSFADFMATGRAPYVQPTVSTWGSNTGKTRSTTTRSIRAPSSSRSLHPRTPGVLTQERALFRSF